MSSRITLPADDLKGSSAATCGWTTFPACRYHLVPDFPPPPARWRAAPGRFWPDMQTKCWRRRRARTPGSRAHYVQRWAAKARDLSGPDTSGACTSHPSASPRSPRAQSLRTPFLPVSACAKFAHPVFRFPHAQSLRIPSFRLLPTRCLCHLEATNLHNRGRSRPPAPAPTLFRGTLRAIGRFESPARESKDRGGLGCPASLTHASGHASFWPGRRSGLSSDRRSAQRCCTVCWLEGRKGAVGIAPADVLGTSSPPPCAKFAHPASPICWRWTRQFDTPSPGAGRSLGQPCTVLVKKTESGRFKWPERGGSCRESAEIKPSE